MPKIVKRIGAIEVTEHGRHRKTWSAECRACGWSLGSCYSLEFAMSWVDRHAEGKHPMGTNCRNGFITDPD